MATIEPSFYYMLWAILQIINVDRLILILVPNHIKMFKSSKSPYIGLKFWEGGCSPINQHINLISLIGGL